MSLSITYTHEQAQGIVNVSGEVDVSCADELRTKLQDALSDDIKQLIIDIEHMSYIDSTGIGVLVGMAHQATTCGVSTQVVHPQRNVLRILSMLGVCEELGISQS